LSWNDIPSPQIGKQPFPAIVTAKDAFNTTVTNFTNTVTLSGSATAFRSC